MFKINREQMRALDGEQARAFEDRLVAHLREHFPETAAALGDARLRQFVADELAAATRFDVVSERDVAGYVAVALALRPDPDADPEPTWVKEVLSDPLLSPAEKVERLERWVAEELDEQQERQTDEQEPA
jgi:hypothetical protein